MDDESTIKRKLKELISLNNIGRVINELKLLSNNLDHGRSNSVVLISNSYSNLISSYYKGVITQEDYSIGLNKINEKILLFIDSELFEKGSKIDEHYEKVNIENLTLLYGTQGAPLIFEILVANYEKYDKWYEQLNFNGIIRHGIAGYEAYRSRILFEVEMPIYFDGKSQENVIGIAFIEKDYDFGYKAIGDFECVCDTGRSTLYYHFSIKCSTNIKIPKKNKFLLRILLTTPKHRIIEIENKEDRQGFFPTSSRLFTEVITVSLVDKENKSINYSVEAEALWAKIANPI